MIFCIHEYSPAINLANAYGYRACMLCGKPHPDTEMVRATAISDGRDYTPRKKILAIKRIKKQKFFGRMK